MLNDLMAALRELLNPNVPRSGQNFRLLRHWVDKVRAVKGQTLKPKHSDFKAY